jgi:hypothetical protein
LTFFEQATAAVQSISVINTRVVELVIAFIATSSSGGTADGNVVVPGSDQRFWR